MTRLFQQYNKTRADIEERNRIRAEAKLPLLSVAQELRRRYDTQHPHEFEQFFQRSPLRARVDQKLINVARRMRKEPDWVPTGVLSGGRLGLHLWTRKLMQRIRDSLDKGN